LSSAFTTEQIEAISITF